MNDMHTKSAEPTTPTHDLRRGSLRGWRMWSLLVPAVGLAFELVVLARATTGTPDLPLLVRLGLAGYWSLPFLLAGLLIWSSSSRTTAGWRWAVGLAGALGLSGVGGYIQVRSSVDASLLGLSGPLVQLAAVVAIGTAVLVLAGRARASERKTATA